MDRPHLIALELAEEPDVWAALGFAVDEDRRCRIGGVTLTLTGGDGGIRGWTLAGAIPGDDGIDGLPTSIAAAPYGEVPMRHANGAVAVDHVVVTTPDLGRTLEAFEGAGFWLSRVRDAGTPERPLRQGFLLTAEALVEVVGPLEPEGHGPASFWGLTISVADLDRALALLGDRASPARPAVQPGRHITTLRREAGLRTPVALMSPRDEPS
jgi:hypothetical protein